MATFGHMRWQVAQRVENWWWQRYLHAKPVSEYLRWKKEYWLKVLGPFLAAINLDESATILDTGCGPAGAFMAFPRHRVRAIDPLLENYKKLEHFNPEDYPNVRFERSTIEALDVKNVYDLVLCMNVINHVQDYARAMDAMVDSMTIGGSLLFSIDAHNHSFFKQLFRSIPMDILHPHQYDLEEYRTHLESRGLVIEGQQCLKQEYFFDHWVLHARKPG